MPLPTTRRRKARLTLRPGPPIKACRCPCSLCAKTMALAFQRQEEQLNHESEQLARQLQALDQQDQMQRQRQQRNDTNRRRQQPGRPTEETKAGCTIS